MLKLHVIVGSIRQGRAADAVMKWLGPVVKAHPEFETEILDLRDWPLPLFQETMATVGDRTNPTYSTPVVKQWNTKIKEADAYIFVTPEYNHSTSGVLKNAIDSVFFSLGFRYKVTSCVSYSVGVGGGVRAVEHLNQILLELEAVPLRTPTVIPFVNDAFDGEGKPKSPALAAGLNIMLEDLAWLAKAMKTARAGGFLRPATARLHAALSAPPK